MDSPSKKKQIQSLYDQGFAQSQIAKLVGISRQYVSSCLLIEGKVKKPLPLCPEEIRRLHREFKMTPSDIAKKLKTTTKEIKTILGIAQSPDSIVVYHYQKTQSIEQTKTVLNMSYRQVRDALIRSGVEIKQGRKKNG